MTNLPTHKLTEAAITFRPLHHQWAFDFFAKQQQMHWTHDKIDMVDDCRQFHTLLLHEKEILQNALLMFTQTDTEVARIYLDYYIPTFKLHTARMMLISFANIEAIHAAAYDRLNTALSLNNEFYSKFLDIKSMYDKYDYMRHFDMTNPQKIALTLAIVSGFIEGVVLFASFAMIASFSSVRINANLPNVMFGTGQIIAMSMSDESLHTAGILRLFHEYVKEEINNIDIKLLYKEIIDNAHIVFKNEMNFIDTVYKDHELSYLPKQKLKEFVLYLMNMRLKGLQTPDELRINFIKEMQNEYKLFFNIDEHPLEWLENRYHLNEIVNFFETTATAYNKGITIDAWD